MFPHYINSTDFHTTLHLSPLLSLRLRHSFPLYLFVCLNIHLSIHPSYLSKPARSLWVPRPKPSRVHCTSPLLLMTRQGSTAVAPNTAVWWDGVVAKICSPLLLLPPRTPTTATANHPHHHHQDHRHLAFGFPCAQSLMMACKEKKTERG